MPRFLLPTRFQVSGLTVYDRLTGFRPACPTGGIPAPFPPPALPCYADGSPLSAADMADYVSQRSAATIQPEIRELAGEIAATWAETTLPLPADWTEATALLEASADPDVMRLAVRLLALRLQLSEAGGTWNQVLSIHQQQAAAAASHSD